jgi:hypothetical protein
MSLKEIVEACEDECEKVVLNKDQQKELVSYVKSQGSLKNKRSAAGLRDTLFEELETLRSGQSDTDQAKAVAVLADVIIKTAKLELDAVKIVDERGEKTNISGFITG